MQDNQCYIYVGVIFEQQCNMLQALYTGSPIFKSSFDNYFKGYNKPSVKRIVFEGDVANIVEEDYDIRNLLASWYENHMDLSLEYNLDYGKLCIGSFKMKYFVGELLFIGDPVYGGIGELPDLEALRRKIALLGITRPVVMFNSGVRKEREEG